MYSNRFWTRVQIFWALNHEANPIIPALSLSSCLFFLEERNFFTNCPSVREKGRGKNNNVSNKKIIFGKRSTSRDSLLIIHRPAFSSKSLLSSAMPRVLQPAPGVAHSNSCTHDVNANLAQSFAPLDVLSKKLFLYYTCAQAPGVSLSVGLGLVSTKTLPATRVKRIIQVFSSPSSDYQEGLSFISWRGRKLFSFSCSPFDCCASSVACL